MINLRPATPASVTSRNYKLFGARLNRRKEALPQSFSSKSTFHFTLSFTNIQEMLKAGNTHLEESNLEVSSF